jgi:4-amino-4-deoxy-L-arabinose transferase-like glycosyltransferase
LFTPNPYQEQMNYTETEERKAASLSGRLLFLLFAVALLLRLTGLISFINLDEQWGSAVRVLTGELSPLYYIYLPLINYINAASFVIMFAIGRIVGVWHSAADFRAQYFRDKTPFFFAGRLMAALAGALSAPLAAMIASRLGLGRRSAFIVGILVALWPIHVFLSHIAKPDVWVASALLFLVWSILRKLDRPEDMRADAQVGVALALVLSSKQTGLLVAFPCVLGLWVILASEGTLPFKWIARGVGVTILAFALLWMPINIPVLLDLKRFLSYQQMLSTTQTGQTSVIHLTGLVIGMLGDTMDGMTWPALLAWAVAPLVRRDRRFLCLWFATAIAFVALSAVSGWKVQSRHFLPISILAYTLGCIAALSLAERPGSARVLGISLTIAIAGCSTWGSATLVRQALEAPSVTRISEVIKSIAQPGREKILSGANLGLPTSGVAADDEYARHERLAKKYNVALPERALENQHREGERAFGYYIRPLPMTFGGMEDISQSEAEKVVQPFIWPIQDEEFDLDYWAKQGFTIFVVQREDAYIRSSIAPFRRLFEQIHNRCELVAEVATTRPQFFEENVKIYRLSDRGGG